MDGRVFQLNCSDGGVPKRAVREAMLNTTGLVGDRQAKTNIHGGPERALCLYALEKILELQLEGHPIFPGSIGENLTTFGLDWGELKPGCRLSVGEEVILEISSYTTPCQTIAASFINRQFRRINQKERPGDSRLYTRVLRTGLLSVGQKILLMED
ncbi:MAG: MOSC domain-containing protein [Pyrinomonadaceae bacterium]